ncbi:MAG: CocE/NonD family hydrolase [Bacteriovoracaceae bacterium]|nr:CocE/NonD family hydrolase [Bacteriovoracaceae bacterium]
MKSSFLFLLCACVITIGCGREELRTVELEKEILKINSEQLASDNIDPYINTDSPIQSGDKFENDFLTAFCGELTSGVDPFVLEKWIPEPRALGYSLRYLQSLKSKKFKCVGRKIITVQAPVSLIEVEFKSLQTKSLKMLMVIGSSNRKSINKFSLVTLKNYQVSYDDVLMSDGKTMGTFSISKRGEKRPTMFLRTPYFSKNATFYLNQYLNSFLEKGFNFVVQSNRGVHSSQGEFKWLHKHNISDGGDSIEWIQTSPFSNGKVIPYGVSYDGFNALATGLSKTKGISAVLACSAPINVLSDSFTSGNTVELALFKYADRKGEGSTLTNFRTKLRYLYTTNAPLADYDNKLIGRDLAEWEDLMEYLGHGKRGRAHYVDQRTLDLDLLNLNFPVFLSAGLDNDQDSRDTLESFLAVQNGKRENKNTFLYLHHYGHGCGNFPKTKMGKAFYGFSKDPSSVDLSSIKKVTAASLRKARTYITGDKYPLTELTQKVYKIQKSTSTMPAIPKGILSANESGVAFLYDYLATGFPGHPKTSTHVISIDEDIYVNGPATFVLNFGNYSAGAVISANISVVRTDDSSYKLHKYPRAYAPVSLNVRQKVVVRLPPMKQKIMAGSKLMISFSTEQAGFFPFKVRSEFFKTSRAGAVVLLENAKAQNELVLTIEK